MNEAPAEYVYPGAYHPNLEGTPLDYQTRPGKVEAALEARKQGNSEEERKLIAVMKASEYARYLVGCVLENGHKSVRFPIW